MNTLLRKQAEAELTDENYKKAYEEYTPDVTAQVIKLDSEDKAKEVLAKAKESGADFAQLAKDNSTDEKTKANGGEITFDSASTELPDVVKKATFALNVDGISDVITAPGTQAYSNSFYIVKLIKKTEKSSNWEDYKEKLKTVILTQKQNDATFVQGVISKELQAKISRSKTQPSKMSLLSTSKVIHQPKLQLHQQRMKLQQQPLRLQQQLQTKN